MNHPIPEQLRNTEYRFFLIGNNSKFPIEKRWNKDNNYMFFEEKLIKHINRGGNVGVATGYGQLIVIDFDNKEYQTNKEELLPKTFTTRSANKGLHHYYYILTDSMIKKIGIDLKDERVADIQASSCGLTIPPSKINKKYYSIVDESPINKISLKLLKKIFDLDKVLNARQRNTNFSTEEQPIKIQEAIDLFKKIGIPRTADRFYKCPHHKMSGLGNMHIFSNGSIHCFHCGAHYHSAKHFLDYWEQKNGGIKILI